MLMQAKHGLEVQSIFAEPMCDWLAHSKALRRFTEVIFVTVEKYIPEQLTNKIAKNLFLAVYPGCTFYFKDFSGHPLNPSGRIYFVEHRIPDIYGPDQPGRCVNHSLHAEM